MEYKLDSKDKKILGVLKEHGDYTTREIAKKTLIPFTTINNRIRKLKQEGFIKKFTIELDHDKIARGFVVYVLISADLKYLKEKNKTQYDVAKELKKFDSVERVDIVSGETDIVAIVRVKDVKEFDNFLLEKIHSIDGVANTKSMIVIHEC
ncbi:MAG: Lrp/AsnC family transcriptional regulator [Nanoarchaeota archaeon]|nr:Lrp/AsnC family transcriptional regulator [Nanoarchaeota archaeon]